MPKKARGLVLSLGAWRLYKARTLQTQNFSPKTRSAPEGPQVSPRARLELGLGYRRERNRRQTEASGDHGTMSVSVVLFTTARKHQVVAGTAPAVP